MVNQSRKYSSLDQSDKIACHILKQSDPPSGVNRQIQKVSECSSFRSVVAQTINRQDGQPIGSIRQILSINLVNFMVVCIVYQQSSVGRLVEDRFNQLIRPYLLTENVC